MDLTSKSIGIALSGGGSKGIAHAGVLKLLSEKGITPACISGSSAGAIVGTMYAYGKKPEEILVISAHYDHVGMKNGEIYNGADDDGSGTVALLEIAQAFKEAEKKGQGPKRSILFLHVTGEEHGLHGSRYYSENPLFPLENTIADINIDMIGRRDTLHPATNNYIYVIFDKETTFKTVEQYVSKAYKELKDLSTTELVSQRMDKYCKMGEFKE